MTIADIREKSKNFLARIPRDLLIITILVLACLCSFGLGYLAGLDVAGQRSELLIELSPLIATSTDLQVVAAKGGTKYYLSWCAGIDRISEENKVWFASASLAQVAGYSPAADCKGIQ